jgi:N utilization substance protein A
MKTDFILAITQLAAERNLPKEVVFSAVEAALVSAFKKDDLGAQHNISVKINPASGDVKVFTIKTVVEKPTDLYKEISLVEAQKVKKDVKLGETIPIESTQFHAGRIAAQTAKQVVLQRLREAEREFIFGEYVDREGDIVSGIVQRVEPRQAIIDLGKAEGVLPSAEQMRTERYRVGQRLKLYLLEVNRTNKGPRLILSRSHPNLVRRLFELEVPEISNGIVEIKAVAREAGFRSKVAVAAQQEGIDPVGSCVGLRGVRIQNVVNELGGERIDVIQWHAHPKVFIANALSPAQVVSVDIDEAEKSAVVVVPDGQLSLAIGKEGQNARLAAKLTGWKIDIKSASVAEAERKTMVKEAPPVAEEPEKVEEEAPKVKERVAARMKGPAPLVKEAVEGGEVVPQVEEAVVVPQKVEEEIEAIPYEPPPEVEVPAEKPQIRFAEDIFAPKAAKPDTKKKDKKKKSFKEDKLESGKVKRARKYRVSALDELEEDLEE